MAERFEDLRAWQTARELTNRIYAITKRDPFKNDWALKDQIRRSSISVMSNIAEGFEARTQAQFIDFLGTAKASAGEVRSQLYIAYDQDYLGEEEFESLFDLADKASRQLHRLIRHLEQDGGMGHVHELPAKYVAEAS